MIRNDISTFLNTKNPRWPPYCSDNVKRSLKNTKICDIYLVVEPKMYFLAKPMESNTYSDHHYFIILNLSTYIPHSSKFKITPGNAI